MLPDVAIDINTLDGMYLKELLEGLHERRQGRIGGRRWSRSAAKSTRNRPPLDLLHDYRRGDPPLTDAQKLWPENVRKHVRMARLDVAGLMVRSAKSRIKVRDFRTSAADDEAGDEVARQIMRRTRMKIVASEIIDTFLTMGDAYSIVTPIPEDDAKERERRKDIPYITAEDPRSVFHISDTITGDVVRAVKHVRDELNNRDIAYMFIRDEETGKVRIRHAELRGRTSIRSGVAFRFAEESWQWVTGPDGDPVEYEDPADEFPVQHFGMPLGMGLFEAQLDSLDRLNDKVFNEWWVGKLQSHRQRGVKGLPTHDEKTQKEIDYTGVFDSSPDAFWEVPADVEFWESAAIDMSGITNGVQKELERIAGVGSQPLNTVTPDAADGSAEGASLMREEHVYNIEDLLEYLAPSFAQMMSVAFAYMGDLERSDVTMIEPIFGPTEKYSLSQRSDAASKLKGILPRDAIRKDILQYPPAELPALRVMDGRDLLLNTPAPVPVRPPANPPAPTPAPVVVDTPPSPVPTGGAGGS